MKSINLLLLLEGSNKISPSTEEMKKNQYFMNPSVGKSISFLNLSLLMILDSKGEFFPKKKV